MQKFIIIIFQFAFCTLYSLNYPPATLLADDDINAIVQDYSLNIQIYNQKKYTYREKTVVFVKNKNGLDAFGLKAYHDKATKVKHIEATVYNESGKVIKSIKRKDFKDISVGDGFSVFNDNRMLYTDYIPTSYPFIIHIEKEIESSNTAFLPVWHPINSYNVAVESASLQVSFPENLGFRYKKYHLPAERVTETSSSNSLQISIQNLEALRAEVASPGIQDFVPRIRMATDYFHLEGVDGYASTWEEFGKWCYEKLLKDTQELPEATQQKIKDLTKNAETPLEKAKIVYEYMQSKTRYVSVQVGIGGWKPMLVKDVDKLGYGDCKALTIYSQSLLAAAGVTSYYTLVHANSSTPIDLDDDFVSMQGNHAILAIPHEDDYVWLECTSQTQAFGFQGSFTDNRKVLVIKEDKGEIVKTQSWLAEDNLKTIKGTASIDANGVIDLQVNMLSVGMHYDYLEGFERASGENARDFYTNSYSNLKGLVVQSYQHTNDKDRLEFKEDLHLKVANHVSKMGQDYVLTANMLSNNLSKLRKYQHRKNNIAIFRGTKKTDEVAITIRENATWTFVPQPVKIDSQFGYYEAQFEKVSPQKIIYKRTYLLKNGQYDREHYEDFRAFMDEIIKNDQTKLIYNQL